MNTYHVILSNDLQWAEETFEAETPEQAIELARRFADERSDELLFERFEECGEAINDISVSDGRGNELAVWRDPDYLVRLSAQDLLDAAEEVIARWEQGDLAEAVRNLDAAVARAKGRPS
jgi:hypothetical protein